RQPRIGVAVTYEVGQRDDPDGYEGLAHIVEHLMFRGSANVGKDGYFRYLEDAGATGKNAQTTADQTTYHEELPASELAVALWLESDRMAFLLESIDEDDVALERDVLKNEQRMRMVGSSWYVNAVMSNLLYGERHPYAKAMESLDALKIGGVR